MPPTVVHISREAQLRLRVDALEHELAQERRARRIWQNAYLALSRLHPEPPVTPESWLQDPDPKVQP